MTCSSCGELASAGDSYCEACGAELRPPTAAGTAPGAPGTWSTGATAAGTAGPVAGGARPSAGAACPTCSAPGAEATPDSYCGRCGRRWSPVRDHEELVDGPVAGVTDRGVDHWRNEDAVGVCWVPAGGFALVVCDGVSASQEPHAVSRAAVEAALPVLRAALDAGEDLELAMLEAVAEAQAAAAMLPFREDAELGPGACTFVAAAVQDGRATFGSVGDSRAYWIGGDSAWQIGRDHSVAAEMVATGLAQPHEAVAAPGGHAITKWLGVDSVDSTPSLTTLDLPGPGLVLAVSDGLWNYTPEVEHLRHLVGPLGSESALGLARRLTEYAERAGGADNITVAVGPHALDLPRDQGVQKGHDEQEAMT